MCMRGVDVVLVAERFRVSRLIDEVDVCLGQCEIVSKFSALSMSVFDHRVGSVMTTLSNQCGKILAEKSRSKRRGVLLNNFIQLLLVRFGRHRLLDRDVQVDIFARLFPLEVLTDQYRYFTISDPEVVHDDTNSLGFEEGGYVANLHLFGTLRCDLDSMILETRLSWIFRIVVEGGATWPHLVLLQWGVEWSHLNPIWASGER
jgi:hypothetical protein